MEVLGTLPHAGPFAKSSPATRAHSYAKHVSGAHPGKLRIRNGASGVGSPGTSSNVTEKYPTGGQRKRQQQRRPTVRSKKCSGNEVAGSRTRLHSSGPRLSLARQQTGVAFPQPMRRVGFSRRGRIGSLAPRGAWCHGRRIDKHFPLFPSLTQGSSATGPICRCSQG